MHIELINTGSELMLGRVLNTHQQWLCRQLADAGYLVDRQVAIADSGPAIQQVLREALSRADLIITTGGLGPTSDDITRDLVASLLGRRLHRDEAVLARLAEYFTSRQRPQPESTKIQAQVPEGAEVLMNAHGTAPGLVLETETAGFGRADGSRAVLVMLPGPPRELRPMFTNQVLPLIRQRFPLAAPYAGETLRSSGLGESRVEEMIAPHLAALVARGLEIGYCARPGEVDVRLVAHGPDAAGLVREAVAVVRPLLSPHIYGENDVLMEEIIIHLLTEKKQSLAVAESCTGGFLTHRLTNVPGASAVLWGGVNTYANAAKQRWLGVDPDVLAAHGAVSEPVARLMAEGVRRAGGTDYGLGITGIAGPGGGTPEKSVGTVYLALAGPAGTVVRSCLNRFDRETFKQVTTQQALDLLRRDLTGLGG